MIAPETLAAALRVAQHTPVSGRSGRLCGAEAVAGGPCSPQPMKPRFTG